MSEPTVVELLARIEVLERGEGSRSRPRARRRRFVVVAAMAIALLAVPIGVFASHQFTDVPSSHQFHGAISKLKGAGITAGCTATKYCPGNAVNRGSMAAFLTRAAGRGSYTQGANLIDHLDPDPTLIGTITIKAGDVTGGSANVHLDASVVAYTEGLTGCPCGAVFYFSDGTDQLGFGNFASLTDLVFDGGSIALDNPSVTVGAAVPTGVTRTFYLYAELLEGTQDMIVFADMTAEYFPFSGSGANPSLTSTTSTGIEGPDWAP